MTKVRRPWRWRAVAGMLLMLMAPGVVVGVVLHLSDRYDVHMVERQAEMWAHRRLISLAEGAKPAPFTSDGCSGGMSATWREAGIHFPQVGDSPPWEACCIAHDRAYHVAGGAVTAEASFEARLDADQRLRACVAAAGPDTDVLAEAMYLAVRAGGGPCSGLPWRWGFGFPPCHLGRDPVATAQLEVFAPNRAGGFGGDLPVRRAGMSQKMPQEAVKMTKCCASACSFPRCRPAGFDCIGGYCYMRAITPNHSRKQQ